MAESVLRNHLASRLAHFLFLLPFLLGIESLLVHHENIDIAVFSLGTILVLILIIYGNRRPIVTIETNRLVLYLNHRHTTQSCPYEELKMYQKLSPRRIRLVFAEAMPVNLQLGRKDINRLIDTLNEQNIHSR